jgi:hypothetical protein
MSLCLQIEKVSVMSSRKLTGESSDWVIETENSLRFLPLLSHGTDGPDLSVTLVEIDGAHKELRTLNSSRLYVILEGSFHFSISSSEGSSKEPLLIGASAGESLIIKRGDWYSLKGVGKYLVINGPAIQPGDDIYSGR